MTTLRTRAFGTSTQPPTRSATTSGSKRPKARTARTALIPPEVVDGAFQATGLHRLAVIDVDSSAHAGPLGLLLTAAWTAAFTALGSVDAFNRIQREQAAAKYHPVVVKDIASLRGCSADLMKAVEFRIDAALFDAAVQQNGIGKTMTATKTRVETEKPATQLALVTIAVTERANGASSQWVADCTSRRLGILDGSAVAATANAITAKRANAQYSLITESGTKEVSGL